MMSLPGGSFSLKREGKPFWDQRGLALMSFVIPFAMLGLAYGILQVFPFGKRHLLTVDLYHQYAPFLALLRQKLLEGSSLFYTTSIGLGTNFYALIAYYLASPFNLLLLLFPASYLTEAIFLMTLLKVGLAGFAFYHYLRVSYRRRGALAVAFSTFYALSGYVIAYSWNIMWLDALILLPLVLLAVIRQIRDGKWLLYPLALALLLISNYYMAFFACIFIALYYPILLMRYTPDRQPLKRLAALGTTLGLTVLGAGLSAIMLYPAWQSLAATSASGDKFPAALELLGRPLAYLGQLFPFLQPTVRSGSPNLYCGVPVLILLPVFFLSRRIRFREKVMSGLLLLFLLLSFDFNLLNFLWHGMHYPNQLPFRFSFVLIFFMLTLAYDGLRSTREFRPTELGLMGLCLTLLIPLVAALEPDIKLSPWAQWGGILLVLLYTLVFTSFRSQNHKGRFVANILVAVMLFEALFSVFSGLYYMDRNEYYGSREGYSAGETVNSIREAVSQLEDLAGEGAFYRLEVRPHKSSNDPALYGYRGLSLFASTSPTAPVAFFRDLGFYNNGVNSYQYRGGTLFTDALFGIRYLILRDHSALDESARHLVLGNESVRVHENPYVFPLVFLADSGGLSYRSSTSDPFASQQDLARSLLGGEGVLFTKVNHDSLEGSGLTGSSNLFRFTDAGGSGRRDFQVTWTAEESGPHYISLDMRGQTVDSVEALIGSSSVKLDAKKKGISELGSLEAGESVRLSVYLTDDASSSGSFEARVYSLDTGVLGNLSAKARERSAVNLTVEEDHFHGRIQAEEAGILVMTVPYDSGWKAYLDGQPVEIRKLGNALMAISIDAGSHDFFFAYLPPGFHEGLFVTLASAGLLLALLAAAILLKKRQAKWQQEESLPGLEDEEEPPHLLIEP